MSLQRFDENKPLAVTIWHQTTNTPLRSFSIQTIYVVPSVNA
jgi:hypothetical protein